MRILLLLMAGALTLVAQPDTRFPNPPHPCSATLSINCTVITDATGHSIPTVGGTVGGSNKQVEFNDNGVLAGAVGLTYDKVTGNVMIGTTVPIFNTLVHKDAAGVAREVEVFPAASITDYSDGAMVGSIEWAINQLGTNGGLVLVHPGLYPIANSIVIDWDWITLQGTTHPMWNCCGPPWPSTNTAGAPGGAQIVVASGKNALSIGTTSANMHGDSRHKGLKINQLYFNGQGVANYGLLDNTLVDISEITDNMFQGFTQCSVEVAWDGHKIMGNNIQSNAGCGIKEKGLYGEIKNNVIYDNGGDGITVSAGRQSIVTGNALGDLPNCIVLSGGSSVVTANTLNSGCNGIAVSALGHKVFGNQIIGDTTFFPVYQTPAKFTGPTVWGQVEILNPTAASPADMMFNDSTATANNGWIIGKNEAGCAGGFGIAWSATGSFPAGNTYFCADTSGNTTTKGAVTSSTSLNSSANFTIVSCSTSGTAYFSEPLQGTNYLKVVVHLVACTGTASYTYPTAFSGTPDVSGGLSATVSAHSTTAVTVTGVGTSGFVFLDGN